MSAKGRKTYFTVAPGTKVAPKSGGIVFREVLLPSGDTARVMSRRVFDGALNSADKKLNEITNERRKREPAA